MDRSFRDKEADRTGRDTPVLTRPKAPGHKPRRRRRTTYWRSKMKDMPQDLRRQTLSLVNATRPAAGATEQMDALIKAWIGALDEEDLAGTSPDGLAPVLWEGFAQVARRTGADCQIAQMRYADGRGGVATALLIVNEDMPY